MSGRKDLLQFLATELKRTSPQSNHEQFLSELSSRKAKSITEEDLDGLRLSRLWYADKMNRVKHLLVIKTCRQCYWIFKLDVGTIITSYTSSLHDTNTVLDDSGRFYGTEEDRRNLVGLGVLPLRYARSNDYIGLYSKPRVVYALEEIL